MENQNVQFIWHENHYNGKVEREYENAILVVVADPCIEIKEKYHGRLVVSKKAIA